MITEITRKIKISLSEAQEMAAYVSEGAVYDEVEGELTFKVKRATNEKNRLIYINNKVVTLVEGTNLTITSTLHIIEEFNTIEQMLNRIETLNLEYTPEEEIVRGEGSGIGKKSK